MNVVLVGWRRTPYRAASRRASQGIHQGILSPPSPLAIRPAPVEEVRWRHRCLWIHLLNRLPWRVTFCCSRQQQQQQQQYQPKQGNDNVDNTGQSGGAPQPSSDGEAPRKVSQRRGRRTTIGMTYLIDYILLIVYLSTEELPYTVGIRLAVI